MVLFQSKIYFSKISGGSNILLGGGGGGVELFPGGGGDLNAIFYRNPYNL